MPVSAAVGSGVKSAERALSILELFSRRGCALTFTEVGKTLGYPRSSLHGLLRTLTERGWLHFDPITRCFSLGLRAWEAGTAYAPADDLVRRARPIVAQLQASLGGDVDLAMLDGPDAVSLLGRDGAPRRVAAASSGAGRVLLAHLDHRAREAHLRGTDRTVDIDDLHHRLDSLLAQGWGGDGSDGDVAALAVPVRDDGGAVVAALSLRSSPAPFDAAQRDDVLRTLRDAAAHIATGAASAPAD